MPLLLAFYSFTNKVCLPLYRKIFDFSEEMVTISTKPFLRILPLADGAPSNSAIETINTIRIGCQRQRVANFGPTKTMEIGTEGPITDPGTEACDVQTENFAFPNGFLPHGFLITIFGRAQ